jgi:molecular chaperone HscB
MQVQVHPDHFANASDAERRVSMQWATRVNEAYQTLKSPLRRATYLLQLHGIELGVETNTAMPADFLMAQMEWREAIEEAEEAQDIDALEKLLLQSRVEMRRHYEELERQIDTERDFAAAGANVRKLMFLEKLKSEIGEAIVEIEE